jgi:hypothetical protein
MAIRRIKQVQHPSVTQQTNYQSLHQSNIYTPVSLIVLVAGVFLIIKAVAYKEYRAKILRRQINKLEENWLLESKNNKL